jgi:predicted nucleic acid-binding protein
MLLIADTSVLINFLNVDGMHLIGRHRPACVVTQHVIDEVTDFYPKQRERLKAAIRSGHLVEVISVADSAEVDLFRRLMEPGRLGAGESSATAVAINRGYSLAVDDRRAARDAKALAASEGVSLEVLGTTDIIVRLIRGNQLSLEQADVLLVSWRTQYRFNPPIRSFSELMQ